MQALRLVNTKDMDKAEWLEWRKQGIGGSEVAAICGLSRFDSSPLSVYLDKLGQLAPLEESPEMKAGKMLEDTIAKWFTDETGIRVMQQHSIFQSKEHPFMLANIDRWVIGKNEGLEIKNTKEFCRKDWFNGEEEIIPVSAQLQANHYMAILGAERWYVAVLIGGWDFQWRVIERDEKLIKNLIAIESNFWHEHVLKKRAPAVTSQDTNLLNDMYPLSNGLKFDLSESYYELIKEFIDSKQSLKLAEIRHEGAKNKVKSLMGDYELAFWQGEKMFSWKSDKNGSRKLKLTGGL